MNSVNVGRPIQTAPVQTPTPTANTPSTPTPTTQSPAVQPAPPQGPQDQNQVNTALSQQPSATQAQLVSDNPNQFDFGPVGLGSQLGTALGMLGAVACGAGSKAIGAGQKFMTKLADDSLDPSVHKVMSAQEQEQRAAEARARSQQQGSAPSAAGPEERPAPAAPAATVPPVQSLRPRPEQSPEERDSAIPGS